MVQCPWWPAARPASIGSRDPMPEHPHQSKTSHKLDPAGFRPRGALASSGLAADRPERADTGPAAGRRADHRSRRRCQLAPVPHSPGAGRLTRIVVNLAGAVIAALFAQASLRFYLHTHRLTGGLFVIEQTWFAVMFLLRRPAEAVRNLMIGPLSRQQPLLRARLRLP